MVEEKVLSLDISTKTGWSFIISKEDGMVLEAYGTMPPIEEPVGAYPANYIDWAYLCYSRIEDLIEAHQPEVLVIEETSKGSKNSFSQKILEFIHFLMAKYIKETGIRVVYMMTEQWRRELGCVMTKEEKLKNKAVREYKKKNATKIAYNEDGKRIGLTGRKHVNIRRANEIFKDFLPVPLKKKDEDQADALGLAAAYHFRRIKNVNKHLG